MGENSDQIAVPAASCTSLRPATKNEQGIAAIAALNNIIP